MNLVYMARPIYGGWITMTAHLSLTYNLSLFKIGKNTEKCFRSFGYGVEYQNKHINDLIKLDNLIITAIDKNYYEYFITGEAGEYSNMLLNYPTTKGRSVGIEGGFGFFGSIVSDGILRTIIP